MLKMKKLTLIAICLLFISKVFSQTVNDVKISELNVEFAQIVGTSKLFSNKVTIEIDFGQENKIFRTKDTQVKDESGNLMVFNSMVDALNFFSKYGYDFITAYAFAVGNQNVYHYLLRKRK
jgi:hypothetical protein